MRTNVIVVTGVELGWDCVVGVYKSEQAAVDDMNCDCEDGEEKNQKEWNDIGYVFHDNTVEL